MRPVLALLLLTPIALAFDLQGLVAWNEACPNYKELGHAKVVLDDGRHSGSIRRDGSFVIPDVDEGKSYMLHVRSHGHVFDTLRIDVPTQPLPSSQSEQRIAVPDVYPYIPGTPHSPPSNITLPYPILLHPRQKNQYFVERQSFNVMGMLGNPMILMMVVTGVLVFAMPYIMNNLDPEIAKEVQERQAKLTRIQTTVQSGDIRGGINAILAAANEDTHNAPPESSQRTPASTPSRRGGKARKR